MPQRGTFGFEVDAAGDLMDTPANVDRLRRLWLDRNLINGNDLGPGRPGDFDHGGWHSTCHLVAAGCVRRTADRRLVWLEIAHEGSADRYYAAVAARVGGSVVRHRLSSTEGRDLVQDTTLLGLVEGTSEGRISAQGVQDPAGSFNNWLRQTYNQAPGSNRAGGKVWEQWCTNRDLRNSSALATSIIEAYVSLVAAAGDLFPATVARGRVDYGHPKQLDAMITAGFTTTQAASWRTTPLPIPRPQELLLHEATPEASLDAIDALQWSDVDPRYYMFPRKIDRWDPRQ